MMQKKALIEREFLNFLEKAIEINLDFPESYRVNGISPKFVGKGNKYILDLMNKNNYSQLLVDYNRIIDEIKLDLPKIDLEKFK